MNWLTTYVTFCAECRTESELTTEREDVEREMAGEECDWLSWLSGLVPSKVARLLADTANYHNQPLGAWQEGAAIGQRRTTVGLLVPRRALVTHVCPAVSLTSSEVNTENTII